MCRGEIDHAAAEELWTCVEQARTSGRPLVLDLADTTLMDSAGVRVLLQVYRALGRVREAVVLRDPAPAVLRTLTLCRIDDRFTIER